MKLKIFFTILVIAASISFYFSFFGRISRDTKDIIEVESNLDVLQIDFEVLELADEAKEHQRGLMYRKDICNRCAMLFQFDGLEYRSFWMKNTKVSIDIIFIEDSGKVDSIYTEVETENDTKLYKSNNKVRYVLEVKSGASQELGISTESKIDIDYLLSQSQDYVFYNQSGEKN